MDGYYEVLFGQVEQHGGVVSDVVGDAMMAIWASAKPDPRVRQQACRAALGIAAAMSRTGPVEYHRLLTRIGLHSGEIRLGDVGARQHYEYRAVGDIVNTASRLEGLNRQLGTWLLVSAETLAEVPDFVTRELGAFLLPGKSTPLVVHELIGLADSADHAQGERIRRFSEALARFHEGQWAAAGRLFQALLAEQGDDGPARYYADLCDQYAVHGPETYENGAIRIAAR
jgi:adenylate cyclase